MSTDIQDFVSRRHLREEQVAPAARAAGHTLTDALAVHQAAIAARKLACREALARHRATGENTAALIRAAFAAERAAFRAVGAAFQAELSRYQLTGEVLP